jgi:phytoene dehydrogenase-like protein
LIEMPEKNRHDAVVVGSGPNGFSAAITLAQQGLSTLLVEAKDEVGGGMRSAKLTLPGFIHDICSAVHPLGVASPILKSFDLESCGLQWIFPPAALAHPLDNGRAVMLETSVSDTAERLGNDHHTYVKLINPLVKNWSYLLSVILSPLHFPEHPLVLATFGIKARLSIDDFINHYFKSTEARALLAGIACHSIMPTDKWGGASFGLVLAAAGHAIGWPVAKTGSQSIANALKRKLISLGGDVQTGREIRKLNDLPPSRVQILDVTPRQLIAIAGQKLPAKYLHRLKGYKYGPGIFKIDWALSGPIPWKATECLRAATVHLGGSYEEIAEAENAVWENKHPDKPLVILAQPSLFDVSRVPAGKQTAWAYCHVPNGSIQDMTARIEKQVERFAPGFKDLILMRSTYNTAQLELYNPNYVGGDISGGVQDPLLRLLRPLGQWQPYRLPVKGLYLCSSSMPPGAGVHGICGYYAAKSALGDIFN